MKYLPFIIVLLAGYFSGFTQVNDYHIDNRMALIADGDAASTATIAAFINSNFHTDRDKVRAAYTWVIRNITYDTDSMYAVNWNMGGHLKVAEAFRRKKGVCENFAGIFIDIIRKAGLTGVTIDGYTKQGNFRNKSGHTWSAVKINGDWLLFDPTWDKDQLYDYNYFMAAPAAFVSSHIPFDPLWNMIETPVAEDEFQSRNAGKGKTRKNYKDSVEAFMRLSELEKLESTARRLNNTDKNSDLIKNRSAFLNMQIATIYEEMDMQLYNAAVGDLNKATQAYNTFIQQTIHLKMTTEKALSLEMILDTAVTLIHQALEKTQDLGKGFPNDQYNPAVLNLRLSEMAEKIRLQRIQLKGFSKN